MPRPTRTRAAAAAQRARDTSSEPASAPAKVVAEPIRSDEASDNIYGVSDREVERQKSTKKTASAKRAAPPERTTRNTRSRAAITSNATDSEALEDSRKRRDAAMTTLDNLTSTTTDDAPNGSDTVASPVVEGGRNMDIDGSSLLGTRGQRVDLNLSGLEINDSEIFGNLDSSLGDDTRKEDVEVMGYSSGTEQQQAGARSADTSAAFNVSVFRRQPRRRRQSSIVGRDDAPIRPSSRGPTTPGLSSNFNLGNFRRRRRQPSILLSSAQRSRAASEASENALGSEAGEEEEEEDSFLPDAEGTPVRPSRGRPSAADRLEVEEDEEDEAEAEARPRKRKSAESHDVEAAKRQAVESDEVLHQSIEIEMDDLSSPPPSILDRTPELDDDSVLAPPASDSESEGAWPPLRNLGKKQHRAPAAAAGAASRAQKTPELDDDDSELSEPPSLTHSPNIKAVGSGAKNKGKATQSKESPKITTADLEALLPRRRRKVRRGGEGSEDEEAGADVDVYDISNQPLTSRKKTERPLVGSSKANGAAPAKETAAPARKRRQTYGSRVFDKENTVEGDSIQVDGEASTPVDDSVFEPDATTASLDLGEELKAASRKFKEVDKWELEYEEVVESSSPLPEGR
ncbi:hypothetical protein VPNG_06021 [Cytospora leucostoma]|uniref:Uncharacterized protein n=1 Tax=Cytospora leucostoma TaxID=1230097 RepID=A0A423XAS9_9PEZI|nr:hypothetical protein VPNG_06021 [Cytospora leucostoma]